MQKQITRTYSLKDTIINYYNKVQKPNPGVFNIAMASP